ncbi:MAG TPA: response regulator transcription factor [Chitinophaga sp.]|uniref:response regulator transcription factor n=1 Tax=Chitinophaga sp. TaxID=1869181 RepID=UPI002C617888|nr:response regulator transcription factor [Chitinophaga sp.]HVI48655.1 response regulator transcription factor [Chitinophaga sp.]
MKQKVLLAEDEKDLGNVMQQYLELMDFSVELQLNGKSALAAFTANPRQYDALLIDVNLPEMDGFTLAREIVRIDDTVPFIFLTSRTEKKDRIAGLQIGADDYILKPFDIDELILRVRNIIKRKQRFRTCADPDCIALGGMFYYKSAMKLVCDTGGEIMLTPRESELLLHFYYNSNRVLSRKEILDQVWGSSDYFVGRSLDVFVSRFRKYFQHNEHISIRNIYGIGFMFSLK